MRIAYHPDANGPAIKVKCYDLTRYVPDGAEGTEDQQQCALEIATEEWWRAASSIAKRYGFHNVWSAGRMGGWLYTEPMPTDDEAEYPAAFVEELSAHLARAPEIYADALAGIIAQDAERIA